MYRLYGSPGSGSASVEAALAEIGADFEPITVTTRNGEHLTAAFKAINPRQQIPALILPDGSAMTESAAMMLHLADAFPQARLAPIPGSPARANHDRWLIFMAVNIYEGELRKNYAERYSNDPAGAKAVAMAADDYVKRQYEILERAIGTSDYVPGDTVSMADLYLWMLAYWMDAAWLGAHCPNVAALAAKIARRPAIQPIHMAHNGG